LSEDQALSAIRAQRDLFLPKTDFPMKADLARREAAIL
jgi:hypothetical protein